MHDYTKYFKSSKGFDRFILKLYEKYKSYSKFTGSIYIDNLTLEEANALTRLFGVTYNEHDNIKLSIKKFLNIMNNSKYEDFDLEIMVKEYLQLELESNKDKKSRIENDEMLFFQNIINNEKSIGSNWLQKVINEKDNCYKIIQKRYHKNKESLKNELENIIRLINNLPEEKMLLSIYSAKYTKDPHYLDLDGMHIVIFLNALTFLSQNKFPETRSEKIELMAKFNIETDYLSNYAVTYKLITDKDYINQFAFNNESLILNVQNVINLKCLDGINKKVYVFENPSILTEIITHNLNVSCIISGGFPNHIIYLLLDKLISRNNIIYYNGDFDPEGLVIAQMLKDKYNDDLILFSYQEQDYINCISYKFISDSRLQKLSKVNTTELSYIKALLMAKKRSAYQENNKERIINYIKYNLNK